MEININDAFQMLDEYNVLVTVRKHSIAVTKVATFLSQKYLEKKLIRKQDQIRIIISAILHDLLKGIDIYTYNKDKYVNDYSPSQQEINFQEEILKKYKDTEHEDAAYLELKDDYPKIAKIIKAHKFFDVDKLKDIDEKIVSYADKRNEFGLIMDVTRRLIRSHLRYTHSSYRINNWEKVIQTDNKILDLEKELFSKIDAKPKECNELNEIELDELLKKYNINKEQKIQG